MSISNLRDAFSATYKSVLRPHKFYSLILAHGWKLTIVHALLLQITLSLIVILISAFIEAMVPDATKVAGMLDLMLSLVAVLPLILLIPAMFLAIFMNVLNCRGSLLVYFRLSICYALVMVYLFIGFSVVFGFLGGVLHIDSKTLSYLTFIQVVPLGAYSVTALRIAYDSSWFKAVLAHAVLIAIFVIFSNQ